LIDALSLCVPYLRITNRVVEYVGAACSFICSSSPFETFTGYDTLIPFTSSSAH